MNRKLLALTAMASAFAIAPAANATILVPGATGIAFSAFDTTTQGTLLASLNPSVVAVPANWTNVLRSAVYLNTLGTLDFYYQVAVTAIGAGHEVFNLTAANFAGFTVDALFSAADIDGAGIFTAASNPNLDPSEPAGSTTTASRSGSVGTTVRADFGANGLEAAGQTSATYIFRTNATNFARGGSFTTQNGAVSSTDSFQPTGAVPEPGTWAMMLLGFGMLGFGLRRRAKVRTRVNFAMA